MREWQFAERWFRCNNRRVPRAGTVAHRRMVEEWRAFARCSRVGRD